MRSLLAAIAVLAGEAVAQTGAYGDFATFVENVHLENYITDGDICEGPFMIQGTACVFSFTTASDTDPWFYSFSSTCDYYYSTGSAANPVTTPIYGNLTMQPIEYLIQGPPWFVLGDDSVQISLGEIDWQCLRNAALVGGLYLEGLPDGSRILLSDDSAFVRTSPGGATSSYGLDQLALPAVWIEGSPSSHVFLKGMPEDTLCRQLSIGTQETVLLSGDLFAEEEGATQGLLGVVSV
jgi:hypothetical protein